MPLDTEVETAEATAFTNGSVFELATFNLCSFISHVGRRIEQFFPSSDPIYPPLMNGEGDGNDQE
jgi:hypothetical protein